MNDLLIDSIDDQEELRVRVVILIDGSIRQRLTWNGLGSIYLSSYLRSV